MFDADNPNDLCNNLCSYKYDHISGPRGSPDMILNAFHVKFDDKQNEMPPRACTPQKTSTNKQCEGYDPTESEKKAMCRKWA